MKEYFAAGKIVIKFEVDEIKATSPESAEAKAIEIIKDFYHLKAHGAYHNPEKDIKIDICAGEYDEE